MGFEVLKLLSEFGHKAEAKMNAEGEEEVPTPVNDEGEPVIIVDYRYVQCNMIVHYMCIILFHRKIIEACTN